MSQPDQPFKIDKPCPASWEGMSGDERKRFCASCKLHVHNLSEMERHEAEKLLQERSGRLCVSYHCDEQKRPLFRSDLQALAATAATAALLLSSCAPRTTGEPRPRTTGKPAPSSVSSPTAPSVNVAPVDPEPRLMGEVPEPPPVMQRMLGKLACPPSEKKP